MSKTTVVQGARLATLAAGAAAAFCLTAAAPAGDLVAQPAMGEPLLGLTPEQLQAFFDGKARYAENITVEDGLGPIFNKESCGNCHSNPIGGTGTQFVTRFGESGKAGFDPLEYLGGSLLQEGSISKECAEEVPVEANITEHRITNGMMGYGLAEAIPDSQILAVRDAQDEALRGWANEVVPLEDPEGPTRVGRFGWKAQVATVLSFSGDAAKNEMGLTNDLDPVENDPNGINPPLLADCDDVPDPEDHVGLGNGVDKNFVQVVTDFQRYLAMPPQTPRSGMIGEGLFMDIGCGACHHPSFTTADDPGLEDAIRNKEVRFYSDFLLHEAGAEADFIDQGGVATATRLKTPPLAGIRHRAAIWHNGEILDAFFADRMIAAIGRHDVSQSDGRPAAQAFFALDGLQQAQVIDFLRSLGRRQFDVEEVGPGFEELDNEIDIFDFAGFGQDDAFAPCFFGPQGYGPDHPCAIHDVDEDQDVDMDDYGVFLAVYTGVENDCNDNGVLDLTDIIEQTSQDSNANGIVDECECVGSDTDGSGGVDVVDMVNVILDWGCESPPDSCIGDVNNDGVTDVQDLVKVVLDWGSCP